MTYSSLSVTSDGRPDGDTHALVAAAAAAAAAAMLLQQQRVSDLQAHRWRTVCATPRSAPRPKHQQQQQQQKQQQTSWHH